MTSHPARMRYSSYSIAMPYWGIVGLITATARPIAECYTFETGVGKVVLYNEKLDYGAWSSMVVGP